VRDVIQWVYITVGALALVAVVSMAAVFALPPKPAQVQVAWDEQPKDGWTFVGRTPEGVAIRKKYFKEHGVWIFTVCSSYESISAVPVEILQRTQAGDSYK
jgi:hypothetical protein